MWDEIGRNPRLALAVLTLTTVACGTGASPAGPTVPTTVASTFTLSGLVFENLAGTKQAVGGATLGLWGVPCASQPVGGSCITWYGIVSGNNVVSDGDGHYVAPNVPASRAVNIMASKSGYVQPCAVGGGAQTANVEIELVSTASLNTANPQPLLTNGVRVVGTVFETTSDGPQGVPGAYIYVETGPDLIVASTVTDLTGHFTMCNLDMVGSLLYVGNAAAGVSPRDGMAIELKRP